jgi:hypothetical protein
MRVSRTFNRERTNFSANGSEKTGYPFAIILEEKSKEKIHMIISTEKNFEKIQHHFMIKTQKTKNKNFKH